MVSQKPLYYTRKLEIPNKKYIPKNESICPWETVLPPLVFTTASFMYRKLLRIADKSVGHITHSVEKYSLCSCLDKCDLVIIFFGVLSRVLLYRRSDRGFIITPQFCSSSVSSNRSNRGKLQKEHSSGENENGSEVGQDETQPDNIE
jgi:hypothetical protein